MRRRQFVSGLIGTAAGLGLTTATGPSAAAGSAAAAFPAGWQPVAVPSGREAAQLVDVAAGGPGIAWAVGEEGRSGSTRGRPLSMVWDGTAWSRTDLGHLGFAGQLHSVAGSPDQAWAVGTDTSGGGHLLAWDGSTWQETPYPGRGAAGTVLTGVTVAPDGRAWVSGRTSAGHALLHWDGRQWGWDAPLPGTVSGAPSGVHRTPGGEIWVYGTGFAARWDGGGWTQLAPPTGIRLVVTGLLARAVDDVWLTGFDNGVGGPPGRPPNCVLRHWDGTTWNSVTTPFTIGLLSGVTGDDQGRPDAIAGWDFWDETRAHYLRWNGSAWVSERGPTSTTPVLINALARIPGTGEYWSVGTTSSYPYPPAQVRVEHFGRS
ncbi:hypothetical protein [Streptomyces cavernae]|uniref:hypothetical protein n=1 Tax=Streptomyces cavernae TaxID=2259034 RepID=UPI000FEBA2BD|nr:hypothetical protein [Streptomyces cavernae]